MLKTDDFVIVVPFKGLPVLKEPNANVSALVGSGAFRLNRMVTLNNGRAVSGSVYRLRNTDAADELYILQLLNERFR